MWLSKVLHISSEESFLCFRVHAVFRWTAAFQVHECPSGFEKGLPCGALGKISLVANKHSRHCDIVPNKKVLRSIDVHVAFLILHRGDCSSAFRMMRKAGWVTGWGRGVKEWLNNKTFYSNMIVSLPCCFWPLFAIDFNHISFYTVGYILFKTNWFPYVG